jgi:hypothetical protein
MFYKDGSKEIGLYVAGGPHGKFNYTDAKGNNSVRQYVNGTL